MPTAVRLRGIVRPGSSGVGPTVEDRQPEPTASVAGSGPGWIGAANAVPLLDRAAWHTAAPATLNIRIR